VNFISVENLHGIELFQSDETMSGMKYLWLETCVLFAFCLTLFSCQGSQQRNSSASSPASPAASISQTAFALIRGHNPDYDLELIADGNHVLMNSQTGSIVGFPQLKTFEPDYFRLLLDSLSHRLPDMQK
jgi:hypothetical protein